MGTRIYFGTRTVEPWVRVGTVSVPTSQRAEDHGAASHGAAVFDLQVDGVVVDLQCAWSNRRRQCYLS